MEIFIKDKEKLIRHLDFQKDKMKDKVHKLDQYLLGKGPLKGANKVLWEKNTQEVFKNLDNFELI